VKQAPGVRRVMSARDLSRVLLRLWATTAVASATACLLASHLIWNWTPSLPLGLYWLSIGSAPRLGALVAFPVPPAVRKLVLERRYLPRGALLVKHVVATAGDLVCADEGVFAINGAPFGGIATRDSAGRPLPHFEGCGPVAEGFVHVASRDPRSFDSRTFGPVPEGAIRGRVTPLWTY